MVFAVELVRRCPEVQFVLDHIGKPGIRHGLWEPWKSQIRELAALPNIVVKISGVITEADHKAWKKEQVMPYVAHVIECFGFDRVMFGSDWTVSELTHRYPDWVAIVDEVIDGCSEAEARKLLSRYGLAHLQARLIRAGRRLRRWRPLRAVDRRWMASADEEHQEGGADAGEAGDDEGLEVGVELGAHEAGAVGRGCGADLVGGEDPAEDHGRVVARRRCRSSAAASAARWPASPGHRTRQRWKGRRSCSSRRAGR